MFKEAKNHLVDHNSKVVAQGSHIAVKSPWSDTRSLLKKDRLWCKKGWADFCIWY